MNTTKSLAILTAALLSTAATHHTHAAVIIPINNHSFEADFAADNTFPTGPITGWTAIDPTNLLGQGGNFTGVINPTGSTFFPAGAPDGNNAALLFLSNTETIGTGPLAIAQTLTDTLQPNTRYTLSVEVGNIASGTGSPPSDIFGFFDLDGFPGYAVQLLAGDTIIAQDNNELFGSIAEGTFATSTVQVDIGATHDQLGQPLQIRLLNLNQQDPTTDPSDPGIEVDFDNVQLTTSDVPEPTTTTALILPLVLSLILKRPPHLQ